VRLGQARPAGGGATVAAMPHSSPGVGTVTGERVSTVDAAGALAYAAATNDDGARYADGRLAPPVFAVVATWPSLAAALADALPAGALAMVVHYEQDMHFARALSPGRILATRHQPFNVRPGRTGTRYTVHLASRDAAGGEPVLDQYATMFVRGLTGGDAAGPDAPDHGFPPPARATPVGQHTMVVDEDQTTRYRDISGDANPIHVDDDAARRVGLPGRIVHGLCTMAMAGRSVLAVVGGGDPAGLRRLAVRFADIVRPGDELTTTVYDGGVAGDRRIHPFETHVGGRLVVSHGRAELG